MSQSSSGRGLAEAGLRPVATRAPAGSIPTGGARVVSAAILVGTGLMILTPLVFLFYGSLRSGPPRAPGAHFTMGNWMRVYVSDTYLEALLNTVLLSTTVALGSIIVGAILAWIIARTDAPWRTQLALLIVVPLMISNLVTTLAWIALAAPNAGFINTLVRHLFGIQIFFDIYSFWGIVLILVLNFASFAFIPLYAALRSIDGAMEEASAILGASALRTAVKMTLPLVWPATASTFLLIFVFVAETFSVPTLLGASVGYHTLSSMVFTDMMVEPSKPNLAATAGTMLLWIAIVGTVWQRRIVANATRFVTISGKGNRPRTTQLGRWRYAATGFVLLYLVLAVALPYFTLVLGSFMKFVTPKLTPTLFTTSNYESLVDWSYVGPIRNSLLLAGFCALFGTLLYVFISFLINKSSGWVSRFMDYLVIVPTVTPALVLGVGFIWAFVGMPLQIYGTFIILVIAYLTRYIGMGVRQSRAALVQISDELADAARVAGAGQLRVFKDIFLPLLKPSLISLGTVLFIFVFMEISLTILLYSSSTRTLPVLLWTNMEGGYQTRAFAVAVLQATIVFVILYTANNLFGTLRTTLNQSPNAT